MLDSQLNILYEDNHIIVVLKPQNVACCPDESGDDNLFDCVKRYIKTAYQKQGNVFLGLVHRLDRPTGGVMVYAKTSKAAARLSEQMRTGGFEKLYFAVLCGVPSRQRATLENYLRKNSLNNMVYVCTQTEEGAKFAGTVAPPGQNVWSPDDERLAQLDNIQTNLDNVASHDPTGGELIPAPTVGNPWRIGLYYKGGKLVMARAGETYGQGVSETTQIPYSRLLQLGGFALNRKMWPGGSDVPPGIYPDAKVTYPSDGGETKIATLASNSALDTYAYFFESIGNSDISQVPWREMRCTVKSGDGRASSSASVACVAFYTGYYWGNLDLKINGAAPRDGVTVETIGNIVAVSVPLDKYWSRSSTNTWQSDQTLNIVARWRDSDTFFPIVNAAFNDVPLPSVPDPASVDFDEFRQWDFGLPSQN